MPKQIAKLFWAAAAALLISACGFEHIRKQEPVFDDVVNVERSKLISCLESETYNYFDLGPHNKITELHKRTDSLYLLTGDRPSTGRIVVFDIEVEKLDNSRSGLTARVFRALLRPNEVQDKVLEMIKKCRKK